jgi:hypothetical protein
MADKKLVKELEGKLQEAERAAAAASEKSARARKRAAKEQERSEVLAAKAVRKLEKAARIRAELSDAVGGSV